MPKCPEPKRPGLWLARGVPLGVTGLVAGFAVWGVAAPAWEQSPALGLGLGAVFAGSAAMTPVMLFTAAKARAAAAAGLIGVCAVFGAIDATGWSLAAARLERQLAAAEVKAELDAWTARHAPLAQALTDAQAAEAAVPLASSVCPEGVGPKGCETRQAGVTADRTAAAARTAEARAALEAFEARSPRPEPRDLVPDEWLHLIGALIQLALAAAFLCVELTREHLYRQALAGQTRRPARRRNRTHKPNPAAQAKKARKGPGPVLVFSRD